MFYFAPGVNCLYLASSILSFNNKFILNTQNIFVIEQGKEGLITELRKELNVTDTEHGELLGKINSDKSIKMIRCL